MLAHKLETVLWKNRYTRNSLEVCSSDDLIMSNERFKIEGSYPAAEKSSE